VLLIKKFLLRNGYVMSQIIIAVSINVMKEFLMFITKLTTL